MSKLNLTSIAIGPKAKVFETQALGTFIADIESTESMNPTNSIDPANNQFNMYDLDNENMIRNIYPITDMKVRSYRYTKTQSELTNSVDDYIEVYIPPVKYDKICQHGDFTFMLSELTAESPQAPYSLTPITDYYPRIIYPKSIQSIPNNTYVYPSSGNIESDGELSALLPIYNLSGINYNYAAEIPTNDNYFFFRDGQALGDAFNTKNAYDAFYNMNSLVVSTDTDEVSATLSDARTYNRIGSTGDVLWMTYNIDRSYESIEPVSAINMPGEVPLSGDSITVIPMSGQTTRYYPDTIDVSNSAISRTNTRFEFDAIYNDKPSWKLDYHQFDTMPISAYSEDLLDIDGIFDRVGTTTWSSSAAIIYATTSGEVEATDVWYLEGTDTLSGSVLMWADRDDIYPPLIGWNVIEPSAANPIVLSYEEPAAEVDEYSIRWDESQSLWQFISLSGLESSPTSAEYYTHSTDTYLPTKTNWLSGETSTDLLLTYNPSYKQFEMVETVKSTNRFAPIKGRKSNLYSINIQNAGINTESTISSAAKKNIQKSINNIIRDMTKVTMPLNTQLFNIYWTGD